MNRLWKQFFGNGLSMVVDDLGAQGEPPSPSRTARLARRRVPRQRLGRETHDPADRRSSTYRQSSSLRPELRDIDPTNRLLASQNPRRLEAEFVRDNALFIAGLLNPRHRRPEREAVSARGLLREPAVPGSRLRRGHRRPPVAARRSTCTGSAPSCIRCWRTSTRRRATNAPRAAPASNTPQQALTLLNDPTFVEAARVLRAAVAG